MNWSRLTLICLASCSLCLALPLADSAAEAEAVADADAEARYGAYGGYYRPTLARAGRRYSGHHGHYSSHYGGHRGHTNNIQRYGYTFKGPIKAPAFKGPQTAPPTEELERFLDLRKSGRPAIRLGSSIGNAANTIVGAVEQKPVQTPLPSTVSRRPTPVSRRPAPVSRRPAPAPVSRRPPP